jgi:RNA polymerase sigma factor for flagellar operon FliA
MGEGGGLTYTGTETGNVQVIDKRARTIEEHMWLVRCIAKSIADCLPHQVDADDLVSAGTVGLIKAVDDFDPAKGAKLETYARYRIRGSILDELRKQDMLPYSTRTKLRAINRAIHNLERRLGRYPTDIEIVKEAGISEDEMSRLLAVAMTVDLYSLDDILENGGEELKLAADQTAAQPEDPLSRLEREEIARVMVAGLKELPQMERTVLGLYYYEGLRMKEIGEVLGVSESRISQIHSKAIMLLRAKLRIHLWG